MNDKKENDKVKQKKVLTDFVTHMYKKKSVEKISQAQWWLDSKALEGASEYIAKTTAENRVILSNLFDAVNKSNLYGALRNESFEVVQNTYSLTDLTNALGDIKNYLKH